MSQYYRVKEKVLWSPSNGVARLFADGVEAVAPAVGLPTGLGPEVNDEYEIDLDTFAAFVDALVRRYCASTHPLLRALTESVAAIGVVLVERAGGSVPGLTEPPTTIDQNDIAIFTTGLGALGDPARLRDLADELSSAMVA